MLPSILSNLAQESEQRWGHVDAEIFSHPASNLAKPDNVMPFLSRTAWSSTDVWLSMEFHRRKLQAQSSSVCGPAGLKRT